MGKNKRSKAKGKALGANVKGGPVIFEDNSLSTLEQNQQRENSGDTESQQTGVSESDLDLDKPVVDDDKQNIIPEVEGAESSLQGKSELEEKVKSLQEDVHQCLKKEVQLNKRIKALEDDKNTWIIKQSSNEETMCKLDGTNAELQIKVNELGESGDRFSQENLQLMNIISLLELRVQKLETLIMESLSDKSKEPSPEDNKGIKTLDSSPELVVRSIEDPQEVNRSYEEPDKRSTSSENHKVVEFESSTETGDVAPSGHVSALYSSSNVLKTISIDGSRKEASAVVLPTSADQSGSQEILPSQLNEIEIQEVDSGPAVDSEEKDTVPLTDAPLIGAPFRLISFMAKYVSGSDLVKENARTSRT